MSVDDATVMSHVRERDASWTPVAPSHIATRVRANCIHNACSAAVVEGGRPTTYGELGEMLDSAVSALRSAGVSPGDIVAIRAQRVGGLPVAVLSVWEVGATAAIVDATQPAARLRDLEEVARPNWRLVLSGRTPFDIARMEGPVRVSRAGRPDVGADSAGIAASHILFTSGTTGRPAAVEVGRDAFCRALDWYLGAFSPQPTDRVALLAGLGHDPMLRDSLAPLTSGGTLVIPPEDMLTGPERLLSFIRQARITILHCTPMLLELILAAHAAGSDKGCLGDVRLVISAGAPLLWGTARRLRQVTDAVIVNAYGATETPQIASCEIVLDHQASDGRDAPDDAVVGVGSGVGGAELLIVNQHGHLDEVMRGEVVVRSRSLARGYLPGTGRNGRFIPDPRGAAGYRAYRTGDLGERGADGSIRIIGRLDRQMSVNGFRVESAEIEQAAMRHPAVAQAVVRPVHAPTGDLIELSVVLVAAGATDARALRGFLRSTLPSFAVPSCIIVAPGLAEPGLAMDANDKVRLG